MVLSCGGEKSGLGSLFEAAREALRRDRGGLHKKAKRWGGGRGNERSTHNIETVGGGFLQRARGKSPRRTPKRSTQDVKKLKYAAYEPKGRGGEMRSGQQDSIKTGDLWLTGVDNSKGGSKGRQQKSRK